MLVKTGRNTKSNIGSYLRKKTDTRQQKRKGSFGADVKPLQIVSVAEHLYEVLILEIKYAHTKHIHTLKMCPYYIHTLTTEKQIGSKGL